MNRGPLRGILLILCTGLLCAMLPVASLFILWTTSHRLILVRSVLEVRARLLATSGVELVRMEVRRGAAPSYGGEDYNGDGIRDAGGRREKRKPTASAG